MSEENKNLKDTGNFIKDSSFLPSITNGHNGLIALSYKKTSKLITALYMVTDTMENDEPMRLRLRTLGVEILSDINYLYQGQMNKLDKKVGEILAFLSISEDMGMITRMNAGILKKEFAELKGSIKNGLIQKQNWFEEFINTSPEFSQEFSGSPDNSDLLFTEKNSQSIGHENVLKKGHVRNNGLLSSQGHYATFEMLKSKRRDAIVLIIKNKKKEGDIEGSTITDIKNGIKDIDNVKAEALVSCGEKTLQRELVSMVKDGVLKKSGEKRWSQYFLA